MEVREGALEREEHALDVDVVDLVELGLGDRADGRAVTDTSVGDYGVDVSVLGGHRLENGVHLLGVGDVGDDPRALRPELGDRVVQALPVDVRQNDRGALLNELAGDGEADASHRSGHNGDLLVHGGHTVLRPGLPGRVKPGALSERIALT